MRTSISSPFSADTYVEVGTKPPPVTVLNTIAMELRLLIWPNIVVGLKRPYKS